MRQGKRHRDQPGLHGAQERQDVFEALRCQDQRPVAGRGVLAEFAGHVEGAARQLRPGEAFGDTGRAVGVVGEGECDVVRAQARTSVQHRQDG
ncbi:Uncharacterised protein [Mycobacteroides abscessus subsp. massiliense]|nr:Uncharacterised protein [Mycobacteroides abscessus subsp. massiliense]